MSKNVRIGPNAETKTSFGNKIKQGYPLGKNPTKIDIQIKKGVEKLPKWFRNYCGTSGTSVWRVSKNKPLRAKLRIVRGGLYGIIIYQLAQLIFSMIEMADEDNRVNFFCGTPDDEN